MTPKQSFAEVFEYFEQSFATFDMIKNNFVHTEETMPNGPQILVWHGENIQYMTWVKLRYVIVQMKNKFNDENTHS